MALQRQKEAPEKAKMELSTVMQTEINPPFITADQSGPKHLNLSITRAKLEQLVDDLVKRTIPPMQQVVDQLFELRARSEEHTSELQSLTNLVCRLLLEKKNTRP